MPTRATLRPLPLATALLVVACAVFLTGAAVTTGYFAEFRVSTTTVVSTLPQVATHGAPFSVTFDPAYLQPLNVPGEAEYEIRLERKCLHYTGFNCDTFAPNLCQYLEVAPGSGGDGSPLGGPGDQFGVATGILSYQGDIPDDLEDPWELTVFSPCFEGECPVGYLPNDQGASLSQSMKGMTFECDVVVSSGFHEQVRATPFAKTAYAQSIDNGNIIHVSATFTGEIDEPESPACTENCNSSVMFLPGLEASRLHRPDYSGGEEKLWEPGGNSDVTDLYMDEQGVPTREDIYVKPGDVIKQKLGLFGNVYQSFIDDLEKWKNDDDVIEDFAAIPYDWRLSLDQLLQNGNQYSDGRVYYSGGNAATSTPYIIQELRRLAAGSRTGKVTIVAHSNGGLLAKELLRILGDSEAQALVDKLILVASPQAGTPQALGAVLHGYKQGLPTDWFHPVLSPLVAREMARNMPSAYHLLPSASYYTYVDDPIITFADTPYLADFRSQYGGAIHSAETLKTFLVDQSRSASSSPSNIVDPIIGNGTLYDSAQLVHSNLNVWVPPAGIKIVEVAGWGEDTLATIKYYSGPKAVCSDPGDVHTCVTVTGMLYKPYEVIEGDGTVLVPSALWMPSTQVEKYWVDLRSYNEENLDRDHADILEIPELRTHIFNVLKGSTTSVDFISTGSPTAIASDNRLRFLLHSPLYLSIQDGNGNIVSHSTTTIPGARYKRYGEVQVITVPKGVPTTLHLDGYASGSFTLDIEEINGLGTIIASTTFMGIPSSTSTKASMVFSDGTIEGSSPLTVDHDGDGEEDFILPPEIGGVVPFDFVPPELQLFFSTTSRSLELLGMDDGGISTTTLTSSGTRIIDNMNNTLFVPFKKYQEKLRGRVGNLKLSFTQLVYNGSTSTVATTSVSYKWKTDRNGNFSMFAAYLKNGTSSIEAHFRPRRNETVIMERPQELSESEIDEDCDYEPVKSKFPGFVVPYLETSNGLVRLGN